MVRKRVSKETEKRVEDLEKGLKGGISNALLNGSITAAFLLDLTGTILAANDTFAKGLGKKLEEVIGHRTDDFLCPEVYEKRKTAGLEVLRTGKPLRLEDEHEEKIYDTNIHPVFDGNGRVKYLAVSSQDITKLKAAEKTLQKSNDILKQKVEERTAELEKANRTLKRKVKELKKAQKALSESEHRYRELTETIKDVLFVQDMDLNITYMSPSITRFGYRVEEALKLKVEDFMTPESFKKALESYNEMVSQADEGDIDIPFMEYEYLRKDGSTFWGELKVSFLRDSGGQIIGVQGLLRDIDERKKTEEALRQSELRFRRLFDLSPQAIALTEVDTGRLIDVNDKFCQITKYDKQEILEKTTTEIGFYNPEGRKRFLTELRKKGKVQGLEMDFRAKDGTAIHSQMYANVIQSGNRQILLTVFHDMSEEKRLRNQFQKAQRMEAIGNLAGGIAHDFNNLLMGIQGNASLMLLEAGEESHPYHKMLKNIEKHVHSGAKLTRQLLDYARKGRYEVKTINLNQLVQESIESFQRARRQVRVHRDLTADLSPIEADMSQIEQVLLNLYINAADAMPGGGDLFLNTYNVTDRDMEGECYKPKKGRYVLLAVRDTGTGIDKEIQDRIFEPFFTTKEMGKGTGLGLASVYGIVKGHGGYIGVESVKGKGSTFKVFLPASGKKEETQISISPDIITGKGTIFIVDDEQTVLDVGSRMLEKLGYDIFKAETGAKAVEIFREHEDKIDLTILDLIMPGMQGEEVYDNMKKIKPDLKVLLSSGYSIDGEARRLLNRGCNGFIQKPFDIRTLSLKIGEIMHLTI